MNWFLSLDDAKEKIEAFKDDYNGFRPHSALCGLTPNQVLAKHLKTRNFPLFVRCLVSIRLRYSLNFFPGLSPPHSAIIGGD